MSKNILVPMPESKVVFRSHTNGSIYVYYRTRIFRNKNGKPTCDVVYIGKKDISTGKLIPHQRYFEFFPNSNYSMPNISAPRLVQSCGNIIALLEISERIGLLDTLRTSFPSDWDKLLATSFYMLCEGNVMMYIDSWFEDTEINFTTSMNGVDCCKLFASIENESRQSFFEAWIKYRKEQEYIAYDITSISTHAQNIDDAQWGYNRDGERLPQINLGMFYGITSEIPVYYQTYAGSIPDMVCLDFMVTCANDLGIKNVCYVLDAAFATKDNFYFMCEHKIPFITVMPGHKEEAKALIDSVKHNIERMSNWISEYGVYGVQVPTTFLGQEMQAHIYYNQEKRAVDTKEMYAYISKLEEELKQISKTKKLPKRFTDFFTIDQPKQTAKQHSPTYLVNADKVDEKLSRTGFFILLCYNPKLTSLDSLKAYRKKDMIEENFDQFKNHIDFNRFRTHLNKTTEGKMFVGFLTLILRSHISKVIKGNKITKNLTVKRVMKELARIRTVMMSDNKKILMPITKLQKSILTALNIKDDKLNKK